MDARASSSLADLSLVVRSTPLAWALKPDQLAAEAGIQAIALDCASPLFAGRCLRQVSARLAVESLWLGPAWPAMAQNESTQAAFRRLGDELAPHFVVVDLDGPDLSSRGSRQIVRQIHAAQSIFGPQRAILIRPRSDWLSGGRRHLADLTALRHLIEEWDVGAALALDRPFDPTWEAEAAILRLGNRLRLLRLSTAATDRHAIGLARVAARAMATALEQGRTPALAFTPSVPLVLRLSRRAQAEELVRARTAVFNFGVRLRAERAQFLSRGMGPNVRS